MRAKKRRIVAILSVALSVGLGCGGSEAQGEACTPGDSGCPPSDTASTKDAQSAQGEREIRFAGQDATPGEMQSTDVTPVPRGEDTSAQPRESDAPLGPGRSEDSSAQDSGATPRGVDTPEGLSDSGPEPSPDDVAEVTPEDDATAPEGEADTGPEGEADIVPEGEEDTGSGDDDEGTPDDDEGTPDDDEGTPDDDEVPPAPLPYPDKTAYQLKGIQPDFWPNIDEIANNGTGAVAMNLVWSHWEPSPSPPPCGGDHVDYDGHCFKIAGSVDDAIADYSARGVHVTAIVYGVPAWARQEVDCTPVAPGFDIFCKADNPQDYGRFAGMLAKRYNGLEGNGRIIDFVIHNEVNANDWFDIGCGQGTPCDPNTWVQTYADNYTAAYDRITSEQPHAKVLMSFDHHFGEAYQIPSGQNPKLSVKWFIQQIAPKLGERQWRVAYHPYPPNLLSPAFSPFDYPKVTYGNLGILLGFLHAEFPNDPHAWDVQLTESGVNSLAPQSSLEAQATGVCDSLYNALATPGISNYIYHRMKDHPAETVAGLGCGLADEVGNLKPAWGVWALSNRIDLNPPQLSCGFENLPYTRLVRAFKLGQGHWATTRRLPDGFAEEQVYALHREATAGTTMLFECVTGAGMNFASTSSSCEGQEPMGPLGWIHTEPVEGSVALYRCNSGAGDSMISPDPNCESYQTEGLLGYALPWP